MGKAEYGRTQDRTRAINFSSIDEARGLARKLIDRYAKDKYRKNMFEDARVVSASGFSYDEALHPLEYQPSFKPAEPVEKSNNQFSDDFEKLCDYDPIINMKIILKHSGDTLTLEYDEDERKPVIMLPNSEYFYFNGLTDLRAFANLILKYADTIEPYIRDE